MRPARSVAALTAAGLCVAFLACRGATEIDLEVRTNAACTNAASWKGVAVYVGEPGVDVESKSPVLTSTSCDASGQIGSLVVVPTGSKDGQVGIRVVAGLTRNPEECAAAGYDGCIVARRTVDYLPHETETLLIDLTTDCAGNGCDVNHTCVDGSCTDTVLAVAPVAADGGVVTSGPTVRCGDDGTRCPANSPNLVCCVTRANSSTPDAGNTGTCVAPTDCPSDHAALYCDDTSDCAAAAGDASDPLVCCETITALPVGFVTVSSNCTAATKCDTRGAGTHYALCQDRHLCPIVGSVCGADSQLNGYFDCTMPDSP